MDDEKSEIIRFTKMRLETCKSKLEEHICDTEKALQILSRREKKDKSLVYLISVSPKENHKKEEIFSEEYRGQLGWAIKMAEVEFKSKNRGLYVKTKYSVCVKLGNVDILLPKKYWAKYTEKAKRL